MALNHSNSSSFEQLALKGLNVEDNKQTVFEPNVYHSSIRFHSNKINVHRKMCMQDIAAYGTLTVAVYNWAIKHY